MINDIDLLNNLKIKIRKTEKAIEESEETKKLNNLEKEKNELESMIEHLYTYEIKQIAPIIAKLMTVYEGIEYTYIPDIFSGKSYNNTSYNKYDIKPVKETLPCHLTYALKDNQVEKLILFRNKEATIHFTLCNPFIDYIQNFLDFLYNKRKNLPNYEINEKELETFLNEFILLTKNEQITRQQQLAKTIDEYKVKEERKRKKKEFENSCLIKNTLIYNSLAYIINHLEENIKASQTKITKRDSREDSEILYGIHRLTIVIPKYKPIIFNTIIDKDECYPDELYCGLNVNLNKDTNIKFFELKEEILPIINNFYFVKTFMQMIEDLYNEKKTITTEDINQFLVLLSNEKKEKKLNRKISE